MHETGTRGCGTHLAFSLPLVPIPKENLKQVETRPGGDLGSYWQPREKVAIAWWQSLGQSHSGEPL